MQTSLESLLEELFELDPTLRQHEATVRPVLAKLIATQPTISLSPTILQRIKTSMNEQQQTPPRKAISWPLIIGVPTLAAAAIIGILYYPSGTKTQTSTTSGIKISSARQAAFGELAGSNHINSSANTRSITTGAGEKMSLPASVSDTAIGISVLNTTATYSYDGSISIPNFPVLQRVKGLSGASGITAGGLLSLDSFGGLRVDSATATQTTDDGYTIMVDYREGTVSMYKNSGVSRVYPMIEPAVLGTKEGISSTPAPSIQESISTTEAITKAKQFADRHGIPVGNYGAPVVQYWPGQEQLAGGKVLAPATVLFPLTLNGQPVYDEGGNRYGIQVVVDASGSVISVYNLSSLNFTSSTYEVTSSTKAITDYLARGAWMWATKPAGTTKNYDLAAPTTGYMISRYQIDQTTNEYFVPALIFGVAEKDQAATARTAVVVPVLDALLKEPTVSPSTKIDPSAIMEGGTTTGEAAPDDMLR